MCYDIRSISVVILIRTDTTLDLSQKAEKVCATRSELYSIAVFKSRDFETTLGCGVNLI